MISPILLNDKSIASDDLKKDEKDWILLYSFENENEYFLFKRFSKMSAPVKLVKLIQVGNASDNHKHLKLIHFDLFGCYFEGQNYKDFFFFFNLL